MKNKLGLPPEAFAVVSRVDAHAMLTGCLSEGVALVGDVIEAWERGDLAGAVNALELWANEAREVLEEVAPHDSV